jgi:histidinol dehydrogenase
MGIKLPGWLGGKRSPLKVVELDSPTGRRVLDRLVERSGEVLDAKTTRQAEDLVAKVRAGGNKALLRAVAKLDGVTVEGVAGLRRRVPGLESARAEAPDGFAEALERAVGAVERFHQRQVVAGYRTEEDGVELTERRQALRRVGVYVPGGRASYPSTVVMTVVPARVAGVEEIVVATPPGAFDRSPALRYALARLGVTEVWGMGGAHAVAALAYGTETIARVDKIVGPGNAWVTAAKRAVLGDVGIDGLAGPSEVLIVADGEMGDVGDVGEGDRAVLAGRLAADLLAQAEHDPRAAAVLVTADRELADAVAREVGDQLDVLATADTARESIEDFGAALVVESPEDALEVIERLAPEHLQLVGPRSEALAGRVRSAGAIFLGAATPEVFGDYVAGPSHVLPTGGSARFASALGVEDFVRRSHTVRFSEAAARRWARPAACLADAEGLPAHAASARRRVAPDAGGGGDGDG